MLHSALLCLIVFMFVIAGLVSLRSFLGSLAGESITERRLGGIEGAIWFVGATIVAALVWA